MTIAVSEKVRGEVLQIIQTFQKRSPLEPVTQKQVRGEFQKQVVGRPKLSDRHIRRTFRKLREDGRIVRYGRGRYWIREYLEKNIEYLKKRIEFDESFWKNVDDLRLKEITELKQKLLKLEQFYEGILEQQERQEIFRKQKEESK